MNRLIPQQIFLTGNRFSGFSNILGEDSPRVKQLKEKLSKEEEYLELHTKYLEDNKVALRNCIATHSPGFESTCRSQIQPNITIEEGRVADSIVRRDVIKGDIKNEIEQQIAILREQAKTDPNALTQIKELEKMKIEAMSQSGKASSANNKTYFIIVSVLLGISIIGFIVYKVRKAKKSA